MLGLVTLSHMHTLACVHAHTHTNAHTTHTRTHAHTHTHKHTRAHTHTNTHTHTHTQLPSEVQCCGNMLLDLLAGTKVLLVQPRTDISRDDHVKIIHTQLEHYAEKLRYGNRTVGLVLFAGPWEV